MPINLGLLRWLWFIGLLLSVFAVFSQESMKTYRFFKYQSQQEFKPETKRTLKKELKGIEQLQSQIRPSDKIKIAFWNAPYPAYRWHQVMVEVGQSHRGSLNGGRMAILHLAIYDAMVEVWRHKNKYPQLSPFLWHRRIQKMGTAPVFSSFICERSAAASAAKEVISYYFPERTLYLDSLLQEFKDARLQTGLQFFSDVEKGMEIGKIIAQQYISYASTDDTNLLWDGEVPDSVGLWTGNPGRRDPMKGRWKPLTLKSQDQFRPGPPPDFNKDMQELIHFNEHNSISDIAWKWKSEPVWDDLIERKILEYHLDPLQASLANAIFHTARYDAIIAAWDAKYTYWGIRPFQYDPSFKPILVETPNFPGYPAGHTTVAGSLATVLSCLFSRDHSLFSDLAKECAESRFEGGVHFRTDNEVGLRMGESVGKQVIQRFIE